MEDPQQPPSALGEREASPATPTVEVWVRGQALHLAYRRAHAGAAEKLVLLHGIGSHSRSFAPQLAGLPQSFDIVAWDAPGYGASDDPPADLSLDEFADAAAGLLERLGWTSAHVLGHSFGGVIAQRLSQRRADLVQSLVLSDTNAGSGSLPEPERSERLRRRLADITTLSPRALAEKRAPNLVPPAAPPSLIQNLIEVMADVRPAGYAAAAVAMGTADLRDALAEIRVPVLIVHGERDTVIPPSTAHDLATRIVGARLALIPGAGHASNQHAPDAYNQIVSDFVQEITTPPHAH